MATATTPRTLEVLKSKHKGPTQTVVTYREERLCNQYGEKENKFISFNCYINYYINICVVKSSLKIAALV